MKIVGWFRTKAWLIASVSKLAEELEKMRYEASQLLAEARDQAVDATTERDDALERLAMTTRDRDQAWCDLAFETAALPSLPASERAELLLLRDTNRDLESRLHILQTANMNRDARV